MVAVATTAARLQGEGTCPTGNNCFDLVLRSFYDTETFRELYLQVEDIDPETGRSVSNPSGPPAGSGLSSRFGGIMFDTLGPRSSVARELRFAVPDNTPYRVEGHLYHADPSAPVDGGVSPDAAAPDAAAPDAAAPDAAPPADAGVAADAAPSDGGGLPASLDPAFGTGGMQLLGAGTPTLVTRIDGFIVIGATGPNRVMRVDPATGARDLTLGGGGTGDLLTDAPNHTLSPNVVAGGFAGTYVIEGPSSSATLFTPGGGDLADRRFIATGALDTTFGTNGTVVLWDQERQFAVGRPTNDGGMWLWQGVQRRGFAARLRRLDSTTGAVTFLNPTSAQAFDPNDFATSLRGAIGLSSTGGVVIGTGNSSIVGLVSPFPGTYWESFLGDPGANVVAITADAAGMAAWSNGSTVYFPDNGCPGGGMCPTTGIYAHPVAIGASTDGLVTDSSGRTYVAQGTTLRRISNYAVDPTFGNTVGFPGLFTFPTGASILALFYDATTDSVFMVGREAGQVYVAKLRL